MIGKEILEQAASSILECNRSKAEEIAQIALEKGWDPLEVINKGFTPGIVKVGDLFDRGQLFLPELVQCSEVMKAATNILNAAIAREQRQKKGRVVIGTVEGDIHDIGKGIVISLLIAHGFEVYDLGRDVPINKFLDKAEEVKADVIGSSALLTTTMQGQKKLEEVLRKEGLRDKYKTIVGGAPVTERWAARIGADGYAENANEAVKKITEMLQEKMTKGVE